MNKHRIIRISAIGLFAISVLAFLLSGSIVTSSLSTNHHSVWFSDSEANRELLLPNDSDRGHTMMQEVECTLDDAKNLSVSISACNMNSSNIADDKLVYFINTNEAANDKNTFIKIESILDGGPAALDRLRLLKN